MIPGSRLRPSCGWPTFCSWRCVTNLDDATKANLVSLCPSRRVAERASANRYDTIHLLQIDLSELSEGLRSVIELALQERESWLAQAAEHGCSLLVLVTQTTIELYTTDADRCDVLRPVLQTFAAKVSEQPELSQTRTIEQTGTVVARHVLAYAAQQAAAHADCVDAVSEIHHSAALSADYAALGTTLASLFRAAANVGRRVRQETLLNEPDISHPVRELEILAADRIVEEELATWQAQEAEIERTIQRSIPIEQRTVPAFASLEPSSEVRLRVGRSIDSQVSCLPVAK